MTSARRRLAPIRAHLSAGSEAGEVAVAVDAAEVPLAEMFGYATDLRSMSQGRATYTMEFSRYANVPSGVADDIIKART